eukprot:CAMPEP_0172550884 /NCGR_PEP_ID=MMETSP1067-20121228/33393_1 /TAXON_ID=265564 ORGANISM="Thalassiosira punctigera, Strain Tpunct2005C2" /NCGR_SAMPLE_ID=MMETSP1067 /ASSEMBLY_ACC=CAM_ASM_000444 /LENGTH=303 /DNA_ID=CAMNT_0013338563 /DNA_START=181 /DNA_END=1092 /DNA_ORIENTATION=+
MAVSGGISVMKNTSINSNNDQCLSMDHGGDLDRLLDKADVVHLFAVPKGGGSSMKTILAICLGGSTKFVDPRIKLLDQLEMNKFNARHVGTEKHDAADLLRYSARNVLFIMTYRDETDRLGSAIKHVMGERLCKNVGNVTKVPNGVTVHKRTEGNHMACIIDEEEFVKKIIQPKMLEIGDSTLGTFSCRFHSSLEEYMPNLVMMSMNQLDGLFELIESKLSCPDRKPWLSAVRKQRVNKTWGYYLRIKNGTEVEINEWLGHKLNFLESSLQLNQEASCQGKTRQMEDRILNCPNEAIYNFYQE